MPLLPPCRACKISRKQEKKRRNTSTCSSSTQSRRSNLIQIPVLLLRRNNWWRTGRTVTWGSCLRSSMSDFDIIPHTWTIQNLQRTCRRWSDCVGRKHHTSCAWMYQDRVQTKNQQEKNSLNGRKFSKIRESDVTETCKWTRSLQVRFWCSSVYSNWASNAVRIVLGGYISKWPQTTSKTFKKSGEQSTGWLLQLSLNFSLISLVAVMKTYISLVLSIVQLVLYN